MMLLDLEADKHTGTECRSHLCGNFRDTSVMHNPFSHSGSTMESFPDNAWCYVFLRSLRILLKPIDFFNS